MVDKRRTRIDILNDACFKALFRSVEARGMFSRFLSALTGISKDRLMNAKYVGGELTKAKLTERGKVADIIILVDEINEQVVVEMNKSETSDIFSKNASYVFSLFNESTKVGQKRWPKIILINIDNFNKFKTNEPILYFKIRDKNGFVESEAYQSIHVILENFKNSNYNINEEISKFAKFITTQEFSELEKLTKGDKDYMAGYRKLEDLSDDPDFIGYYDYEEAKQHDIEMAEITGIEKGIEQNKKEMVINMKEEGLNLELISKVTKLSIKEVEKILNS